MNKIQFPRTGRNQRGASLTGALVGAAIATTITFAPSSADAVQVELADREVFSVRLTYVEPTGPRRMFVELNNGAAYRLRPCKMEDSNGCYWDASKAGNGRGNSFVAVRVGRDVCVLYLARKQSRNNHCEEVES